MPVTDPPSAQQNHERLISYLRKLYDAPFFSWGGQTLPIVYYPPQPWQVDDVDSLLDGQPQQLKQIDDFAVYDYAHLHNLQNQALHLFNGPTFIYNLLREEPLQLSADLGYYYDNLATSAALSQELKDALSHNTIRLPNRTQLHREIAAHRSLLSGQGRSAAIGVVTSIIFWHEQTYKIMINQRSALNATSALLYHIIPAFILQPQTLPYHEHEWKLSYHIFREYLEELFSVPDMILEGAVDFEPLAAYQDLTQMLADKRASLHLNGVVMNLLTLRPEIITTLIIQDQDWFQRVTDPAFPQRLQFSETHLDNVIFAPIHDNQALFASFPPDLHLNMPPQGFAGMALSIEFARKQLGLSHDG
ncbi:hypothetical protein MASR2M15_01390 [Anaerolineales bacterium]